MDDIYSIVHPNRDTSWVSRVDGVTGEREDMFRDLDITFDQAIEIVTALYEAQERMKQSLLAEMRDFLNRRELNYVRARYESGTDSVSNQSVSDGNVDSAT